MRDLSHQEFVALFLPVFFDVLVPSSVDKIICNEICKIFLKSRIRFKMSKNI